MKPMTLDEFLALPDDSPDLPFEPQPVGEAVRTHRRLYAAAIRQYYVDARTAATRKGARAYEREALEDLNGSCEQLAYLCLRLGIDDVFRVRQGILSMIAEYQPSKARAA
ncbi:hypothetical protein C8D96_3361 [Kushneria marisflavi]|nr:hypothetical protein C8D96_3361 [Kushneria marisflavi]